MRISILPQPGTTMLLTVKTQIDTGQAEQEPEQSCWEGQAGLGRNIPHASESDPRRTQRDSMRKKTMQSLVFNSQQPRQ